MEQAFLDKIKIVFLDTNTVGDVPQLPKLKVLGDVTFYPNTQYDQILARVADHKVIITNKVVIDKNILAQCPTLKLVCVAATGTNNVDHAFAKENNIAIKNVVNYSTHSVVMITIAMVINLSVDMHYYDNYAKTKYAANDTFTHLAPGKPFHDFTGKQIGIIGLGTIGSNVAKVFAAFGAEVVYYSTSGQNNNDTYRRIANLDEFLRTCDIISIHAPLNDDTQNLIAEKELKLMKPTALLVNLARGGIVNEADLSAAIENDVIAGAGVDVFSKEPIAKDSPYLTVSKNKNFMLAPHMGWASVQSRGTLINRVYDIIKEFITNEWS